MQYQSCTLSCPFIKVLVPIVEEPIRLDFSNDAYAAKFQSTPAVLNNGLRLTAFLGLLHLVEYDPPAYGASL